MSTPTVRIVQLDAATLRALADGDLDAAGRTTSTRLSAWLAGPECTSTWRRRAAQVVETPADQPWVTGVLVDQETGDPVGKAGFHAAPDENGMVEVGYAIDPAYRRRGYARAALDAMLGRARRELKVTTLRATVSPGNDASLGLIRQYAFVEVGEQWDEEDGLETIYEIDVRAPGQRNG